MENTLRKFASNNRLTQSAVLAVLITAIGVSAPSYGADIDPVLVPQPQPESVLYDWSGAYVGLGLGYLASKSKDTLSDTSGTIGNATAKPDGGLFGGYAGYNWQMNSTPLVLGLEGDIYGSTAKDKTSVSATVTERQKIDATWSVKGRIGWVLENFMPYISGGYTGASLKTSVQDNGVGTGLSNSKTLHGWTVGAGVEMMINPNWILRADYAYKDFGKVNSIRGDGVNLGADWLVRSKVRSNQFTIGGAYKF